MIRVVVVDDHWVVRAGLKRILEDPGDVAVVGEAGDAAEALQLLRSTPCDVLLMDISMPGRGGLELLGDVRREFPGVSVIVLSIHAPDQFAVRMLKAGAVAYLTKETAPEELVGAVRRASRGERHLPPAVAEQLLAAVSGQDGPPHQRLSDRELQVLGLLGRGRSVSEIASDLNLSAKTVSTYRSRLLHKLGRRTTSELVAYAVRNGLAD